MKTWLVLLCLLWGCQYPAEKPRTPTQFQTKQALFDYVEEANWQLMYQFAYTQSLNAYAKGMGWHPPALKPICRSVDWPVLEEFPTFKPRLSDGNIHAFEQDLTDYIKLLRQQYNQGRKELNTYAGLQTYLCVY